MVQWFFLFKMVMFHVSFAGKNKWPTATVHHLGLEPPIPTGPRKFALALGSKNPQKPEDSSHLDTKVGKWKTQL